jgi:hypothetical protein
VSQLSDDGRQRFALCLSAWRDENDFVPTKTPSASEIERLQELLSK